MQGTDPHRDLGYEPADANLTGIWRPILGLAALIFFSFVLISQMWKIFEAFRTPERKETAWIGLERESQVPPEPRLQPSPPLEVGEVRAEDAARLGSWKWIDERAGTVRIPIDHAMQLVVERGLPHRGEERP